MNTRLIAFLFGLASAQDMEMVELKHKKKIKDPIKAHCYAACMTHRTGYHQCMDNCIDKSITKEPVKEKKKTVKVLKTSCKKHCRFHQKGFSKCFDLCMETKVKDVIDEGV